MNATLNLKQPLVISHAEVEAGIAEAFESLVTNTMRELAGNDIFRCAAALGGESGMTSFREEIIKKIRDSKVVVAILTKTSRTRPWPLWEVGLAEGLKKGPLLLAYVSESELFDSPLNAKTLYHGRDPQKIIQLLTKISGILRTPLVPDLTKYVDIFLQTTREDAERSRFTMVSFDRRIRLVFSPESIRSLDLTGTVAPDVRVYTDPLTLEALGILNEGNLPHFEWGEFVRKLGGVETPWPQSALRWTNTLGRILKVAHVGNFVTDPEGLPLFYSARLSKAFRPTLAQRTIRGRNTEYDISFCELPRELTVRPDSGFGILLHYIDFCRMMRWGVLETDLITQLRVGNVRDDEKQKIIATVLQRIANIRTEFQNRGIRRDALFQVLNEEDGKRVEGLMAEYYCEMKKVDPDEDGEVSPPYLETGALLEVIETLKRINKIFFMILFENSQRFVLELKGDSQVRVMQSAED